MRPLHLRLSDAALRLGRRLHGSRPFVVPQASAAVLSVALCGGAFAGGAALAPDDEEEVAEVAEEAAPAAAAPTYLHLRGKRVIVRPGKVLENTSVLVRDGEIIAIGSDLTAPEGTETVEGDLVCAAFMDAWSVAGVDSASARFTSSNVAAMAIDAVDPYGQASLLGDLVSAGVLLLRSQIGVGGNYGGIDTVIHAAGAEPLLTDAAISARLGVSRGGGSFRQVTRPDGSIGFEMGPAVLDPIERVGQIDSLVADLKTGVKYAQDAAQYEVDLAEWMEAIAEEEEELKEGFKKAKKARDKKVKDAEEDGEEVKEKKYKSDRRPRAPKFDAEKAAMARVAIGEIPIVIHAERALEIRELLRLTKDLDRVRIVIAGGTGALPCAADLAARNIPVIVAPSAATAGGPVGELDPGLALAGELHAAGVQVIIGSGGADPRASADIALLAALAVGHGLDADAALAAITSTPARVFDLSDQVGTVQTGRRADLLVLSGAPLASSTRVLAVIGGGEIVYRAGE